VALRQLRQFKQNIVMKSGVENPEDFQQQRFGTIAQNSY